MKKLTIYKFFPSLVLSLVVFLIFIFCFLLFINKTNNSRRELGTKSSLEYTISHRLDSENSLENIVALKQSDWNKMISSKLPYGYLDESVWVKIHARNPEPNEQLVIILLEQSALDKIEFFQFEGANLILSKKQGDLFKFHERELQIRNFTFSFSMKPSSETEIYLKLKTSGSLNSSILVLNKDAFSEYLSKDNLIFGLFFGFSMAILLYNIIVYAFTSEFSFLISALTLFLYFSLIFVAFGFGYMYLYSNFPIIQSRAYLSFNILTNISMIILFARILTSNDGAGKLNKIPLIILAPLILLLILHISSPRHFYYDCVHLLNLSSISLLILISLLSIKKNNITKYYALSLVILVLIIFPIILALSGYIEGDGFTTYYFLFSSSLILIIIASAMGRKVYNYKSERDHYILRILRSQKHYNRRLEQKVKEKTFELSTNLQNLSLDIELARSIQLATLPILENFSLPNFQVAGSFLPRDRVGGDLFDLFTMDDGRIRAIVCDVTGHGIQAALVTMSIRAELDRIKKRDMPIEKILRQLNRTILASFSESPLYASAILIEIDRRKQIIRYANAGHPSQYIISKDQIVVMDPQSRILGIHDNTEFYHNEVAMSDPYTIYLFSDGVFEEFNKKMEVFGEERFFELLRKNHEENLQEKINNIYDELFDFVGEKGFVDDVTMLFLRDDLLNVKNSISNFS